MQDGVEDNVLVGKVLKPVFIAGLVVSGSLFAGPAVAASDIEVCTAIRSPPEAVTGVCIDDVECIATIIRCSCASYVVLIIVVSATDDENLFRYTVKFHPGQYWF